jgi:hypothetical protein
MPTMGNGADLGAGLVGGLYGPSVVPALDEGSVLRRRVGYDEVPWERDGRCGAAIGPISPGTLAIPVTGGQQATGNNTARFRDRETDCIILRNVCTQPAAAYRITPHQT